MKDRSDGHAAMASSLLHPGPRMRKAAFFMYAALLATATHWPDVTLPGPDALHPDKIVHILAFGLWTALLIASDLVGNWRRLRTLAWAALALVIIAIVDESTQGIPVLHRDVSKWDVVANLLGGSTAIAGAWFLGRRIPDRKEITPDC